MRHTWIARVLLAVSGTLVVVLAPGVSAATRTVRVSSGSYGSVRQASHHTSGHSVERSGSASAGGGQASWNREAEGPRGREVERSGSASREDGHASVNREVEGPRGREVERSASASRDDGHVSVSREVEVDRAVAVTGVHRPHGVVRVGTKVTVLPAGHSTVTVAGTSYYHYGGTYYRVVEVNGVRTYVVIPPPPGVVVYTLPGAATIRVVGDTAYYHVDGVDYQRVLADGQVVYAVVVLPKE